MGSFATPALATSGAGMTLESATDGRGWAAPGPGSRFSIVGSLRTHTPNPNAAIETPGRAVSCTLLLTVLFAPARVHSSSSTGEPNLGQFIRTSAYKYQPIMSVCQSVSQSVKYNTSVSHPGLIQCPTFNVRLSTQHHIQIFTENTRRHSQNHPAKELCCMEMVTESYVGIHQDAGAAKGKSTVQGPVVWDMGKQAWVPAPKKPKQIAGPRSPRSGEAPRPPGDPPLLCPLERARLLLENIWRMELHGL